MNDNLLQKVEDCFNPKTWTSDEIVQVRSHMDFLWQTQQPWIKQNRLHFDNCLRQINFLYKNRIQLDAQAGKSRDRRG